MKTLWNETLRLWAFAFLRIPMVAYIRPRVVELDDTKSTIHIPFIRRTKNHVRSMYFGALSIGAELAPGVLTLSLIKKENKKIVFVFKQFNAEFLKRAETSVNFHCNQGAMIQEAIKKSISTKERQNIQLSVDAYNNDVPSELVGRFSLTLSLKALAT